LKELKELENKFEEIIKKDKRMHMDFLKEENN